MADGRCALNDCTECALAQTEPYHSVYLAGCETCIVRHLSDAPRTIREQYLERISNETERETKHAEIVAEYRRRKALLDTIARRALGLAA